MKDKILKFLKQLVLPSRERAAPRQRTSADIARDALFRLKVGAVDRLEATGPQGAALAREIMGSFSVAAEESCRAFVRPPSGIERLPLKFAQLQFQARADQAATPLAREAFLSAAAHARALCQEMTVVQSSRILASPMAPCLER